MAIERESTTQNSFIRVKALPVKRIPATTSRFPIAIVPITGCECHCVWWPSSSYFGLFNMGSFSGFEAKYQQLRKHFPKYYKYVRRRNFSSFSSCDSLSSSDVCRSSTLSDSSRGSSISEDKNESSRKSGSQCFFSGHSGNMFSVKVATSCSLNEFFQHFVCWHSQISTLMSLTWFYQNQYTCFGNPLDLRNFFTNRYKYTRIPWDKLGFQL